MRTRKQSARVNSSPPQLELMDIPLDSSGDVNDFMVVRSTTGEVALNSHPVLMVLPSSPSSERTEGTMVKFPWVDRPLAGSSSIRVGAPSVTPIENSKKWRVIITAESNEEEVRIRESPRGKWRLRKKNLTPCRLS